MSTLKSPREIDRIFKYGQRTAAPLVIGLVAETPTGRDQNGRVAFLAGKRLGGAVKRNRAKRMLRAAARAAGGPWPGYDVLLMARERTIAVTSDQLADSILVLLERAGVRK
jgi:ribonuclease P protein component